MGLLDGGLIGVLGAPSEEDLQSELEGGDQPSITYLMSMRFTHLSRSLTF